MSASRWIADAAAEILREIGPDAIAALQAGLRAGDVDAPRIVRLLATFGEPSIPVLVETLGLGDAAARAARDQLIAQGTAVVPAVTQALADPQSSAATRSRAIGILAAQKDTSAISAIEDAVSDEASSVRIAALQALGRIGLMDSEGAIALALRDPDAGAQHAAEVALAQLLLRTGDPPSREAGALGLGDLRDRTGVDLLVAALNDPAQEVVLAAIDALGKIGTGPCIAALTKVTKHADADVAGAAIIACGRIRSKRTLHEVMAALKNDRLALREAAVIALQQHQKNVVPELLRVLRQDPAPLVRRLAAVALGNLRDRSVVPDLIAAMEKEQGEAMKDYQDALVTLTGQKGIKTVNEWRDWWKQNGINGE